MIKIGKEEELFCRMPEGEEQIFHFGEVMGLASEAKKAVFLEIKRKGELNEFLDQLSHFAPKKDFHLADAPANDWQTKIIGRFDKNVIIGEVKTVSMIKKLFEDSKGNFSHSELGKLLSYPECCSKERRLSESDKRLSNLRANQIDFRINNFLIRTNPNVMLVRHYLCGYDCKASIRYASKIFRFLKDFPKTFEFVKKVLQMPVMIISPQEGEDHLLCNGIPFFFKGFYENDTTLKYDKIYPLSKPLTPSVDMEKKAEFALKAILSGDEIVIREDGIEILSRSKTKTFVSGDFIFIWPKENPLISLGD